MRRSSEECRGVRGSAKRAKSAEESHRTRVPKKKTSKTGRSSKVQPEISRHSTLDLGQNVDNRPLFEIATRNVTSLLRGRFQKINNTIFYAPGDIGRLRRE